MAETKYASYCNFIDQSDLKMLLATHSYLDIIRNHHIPLSFEWNVNNLLEHKQLKPLDIKSDKCSICKR
jgi:hypothetical protein